MDYSKIMSELDNASLFDLYRLSAAIGKELENPKRIKKIRQMIKAGDTISYFVNEENRLIDTRISHNKYNGPTPVR